MSVVGHGSRDSRSPCANMTLGVAALAADFFGVSLLSRAGYYCVVSLDSVCSALMTYHVRDLNSFYCVYPKDDCHQRSGDRH